MKTKHKDTEPTDEQLRYEVINELIAAGIVEVTSIDAKEFNIALTDLGNELCGDIDDE